MVSPERPSSPQFSRPDRRHFLFKRRHLLKTGLGVALGFISSTCLARSQPPQSLNAPPPSPGPDPLDPPASPPTLTPQAQATPALPASATPAQTAGPFYPNPLPLEKDGDLTRLAGQDGGASGAVIYVGGQVRTLAGQPVADALVEIWQTNTWGRYHHPRDPNTAPLDPNFQGFGQVRTDAQGFYEFKTIRPAAYSMGGNSWRTPHIHLKVSGGNVQGQRVPSLTTQLYFAGEPLNDRDGVLQSLSPADQALVVMVLTPGQGSDQPGSQRGRCDLVLPGMGVG